MTQVSSTFILHAPADVIWQVISEFDAACRYLDWVIDCRVEGKGAGALRTLTSADGGTVVERMEALDEANQQLSYALLTDTPFSECLTTLAVRDLSPSQSELEWSATFRAAGIPVSEAVEMMEGIFKLNSRALQHFIDASAL